MISAVSFVEKILKAEPDSWQRGVLNALDGQNRVAVRSGHGVGKTALESWLALWFLFSRPLAKVIVTAPTIQQLYQIFMSEVSKWLNRSELMKDLFETTKTKITSRANPAEWFLSARTAARPENMQGFHAEHLFFILDEASGIDDEIFEAVEGALTGVDNKLILCGNPTRRTGFFYRAFYDDRDLYETFKVSSAESSRVNEEYCKRLIKTYGADSDVVRVRVLGEFPKQDADGVIPLEWLEKAMTRESCAAGELILGVDVARQGDDLTVVAARLGDNLLPLHLWRSADLMTTVGKIIHCLTDLMTRNKKSRADLRIDDDGLGAGVTDRLREVLSEKKIRCTVTACHNGGKARDNNKYANFITEAMFCLRERLERGDITLPKDELLAAELSTRKYTLNSSDKLILEKKSDFKQRLKRSPDRADAVALCFYPVFKVDAPKVFTQQSYWRGI